MTNCSPDVLERTFLLIQQAAINGERCPFDAPNGPIARNAMTELIRAGRITTEVSGHNWRTATLLTGPHAGKSTAPNPTGAVPYRRDNIGLRRGSPSSPRAIMRDRKPTDYVSHPWISVVPTDQRVEPPVDILFERDRRLMAPRTLTARLMGDPAPGQSALDRRGAARQ